MIIKIKKNSVNVMWIVSQLKKCLSHFQVQVQVKYIFDSL